jgi:hypothetical protein
VEGIHHRDGVGQLLGGGGFEAGEPVHRHDLDPVTELGALLLQPGGEDLFGSAFDHVQQPGRAGAVADRGEVDDHGDVLVPAAGVSPAVLVDPDHLHAVEAARVLDQHPFALGQHRVVGGVPRHRQGLGHPGHAQMLADDGFQRPAQPAARQPRPRLGGLAGVLTPHMPAPGAAVAAHRDLQRRRPPPERLMRQPTQHGVARNALAAAAVAPVIGLDDPAGQHRPIRVKPLPDHDETQLIKAAERRQVRAGEGSVKHVEVFRMAGLGTSILERPRPLSRDRRAATYTVNCEEPEILAGQANPARTGDTCGQSVGSCARLAEIRRNPARIQGQRPQECPQRV